MVTSQMGTLTNAGAFTYFISSGPNGGSSSSQLPYAPGHFLLNRTNSSGYFSAEGSILSLAYSTAPGGLICSNVYYILAQNNIGDSGNYQYNSGGTLGFASIGMGLSATQCQTFLNAVQTFVTALGRQ